MANLSLSEILNKLAKVSKKYADNVSTSANTYTDEKIASTIKFNDNGDLEVTIGGVTKTFTSNN